MSLKSQCTVGNRFIGFYHEHLSSKQKVSMTAPNTTKHNGNSANIIHTQNALQVYERKSAMNWRLVDETALRIYMRQHFQTNYSNESYRLHMSASFFFNAAHSPSSIHDYNLSLLGFMNIV